ncbi:bifunctional folate synthesis protein [Bifidobacterium actinocoloniiforme DSM 22766]|uniref:7,8-dihydroneopterin aldolase n=1 Tax=Bifidobacterium actinocoloniiforme DSM 22766 TaxID=1437605 RepID=A0A086Z1N6_9BIFI|nr:dihydroneopterin aldolase [Bifidobacterium actinocoloniiforme]AKV55557.1 hypothetical protein AB656_04300 [Bifidobacterium actinocoloniiforme DSM 22766]KFI40436.1 bifunctional folate synthesis protein [Bifidobacterium actinocoloniiforme DSM 22766]
MDSIQLTGIRATPRGSGYGRPFAYMVDVALHLDLSAAGSQDDLTQTVDYVQVARRIVTLIEGMDAQLVETVASRVADSILLSHQVRSVEVTVHRLEAGRQTGVDMDGVSVSLTRRADCGPDDQASPAALASGQAGERSRLRQSFHEHPSSGGRRGPNGEGGGSAEVGEVGTASHRAVVAMSGGIGPVESAMRTAIVSLDGVPGSQVIGISPLYRSQGAGGGDLLCSVVIVETPMGPLDLLSALRVIESAHGRSRSLRLDSYPLDLRLIDMDGSVWSAEDLRSSQPSPLAIEGSESLQFLPDQEAWRQATVLKPWADLEPQAQLLGPHGGMVADLAQEAPDYEQVALVSDSWILGGSV